MVKEVPKSQIYVNGEWRDVFVDLPPRTGDVQVLNTGDGEVFVRKAKPTSQEIAPMPPGQHMTVSVDNT